MTCFLIGAAILVFIPRFVWAYLYWHTPFGDAFDACRDMAIRLLFSRLPGWTYWKERQRLKRIQAGLCEACGYDLRATPERCPECGNVAKKPPGLSDFC